MNRLKIGNTYCRSIAALVAALLLSGQAMAQVKEKRSFSSDKTIEAFDNTTFCTAFLADKSLYTLRDIPVTDIHKITKIAFNPTGSSIAVLRNEKPISIYSFRIMDRR